MYILDQTLSQKYRSTYHDSFTFDFNTSEKLKQKDFVQGSAVENVKCKNGYHVKQSSKHQLQLLSDYVDNQVSWNK